MTSRDANVLKNLIVLAVRDREPISTYIVRIHAPNIRENPLACFQSYLPNDEVKTLISPIRVMYKD